MKKERSSFSGSIGFVLAAAGSAVGLGNIWRFPYVVAKDGGGIFLLVYLLLLVTVGFTLLLTEITLGRKTRQGPLTAYGKILPNWKFLGFFGWIVPCIILPYYCVIGGWVIKYLATFATGGGLAAAEDGFFTGFITAQVSPIVYFVIFLAATTIVIVMGVEKGIEKFSTVMMPILVVLVIGIAIFALTLKFTDADGVTRTGLQGAAFYLIPDFSKVTLKSLGIVLMDAIGQMFYSLSIAMGIMVAYGSYVREDVSIVKSVNQIQIFDTGIALVAGMMIVPTVFTFMGEEGLSAGPGLMFVSLPKVFKAMGGIGSIIAVVFFLMVLFAALTSSISIMEAIVAGLTDKFPWSRNKAAIATSIGALIVGIIVCLGYNVMYFEYALPNGSVAQILDILDYISNAVMMPITALLTCVMIGWITGTKVITDEVTKDGMKFSREGLYNITLRFIAPVMLIILLLQAFGIM